MLEEYKQQNLYKKIETLVSANGISYIDAVIMYCENNGLDVESVGDLISKNDMLRGHIEIEAEDLHFLKRTSRLPV
jgi:hypothetical protein